jgi:hypothetical protein
MVNATARMDETPSQGRRERRQLKRERWDDSVARLVPSRWYPILLPGSVRTAFYLSNLRP